MNSPCILNIARDRRRGGDIPAPDPQLDIVQTDVQAFITEHGAAALNPTDVAAYLQTTGHYTTVATPTEEVGYEWVWNERLGLWELVCNLANSVTARTTNMPSTEASVLIMFLATPATA